MRTVLRRLSLASAFAVVALGLTACINPFDASACDQTAQVNIGFVLAHRANQPVPVVLPEVKAVVDDAIRSNGDYVTVAADGEPYLYDYNFLGSELADGTNCQNEQQRQIDTFADYVVATPAVNDEVDLLKALYVAADNIRSKDGEHVLVVIDNGLQTIEPMNLADGDLLYAYPADEIADDLKARNLLPDLTGMTVYWSGMGGAVAPQEPLTIEADQKLKALWRAVIERAGGILEIFPGQLPGQPAVGITTSVTPVPILEVVGLPEPLQITEDSVKFVPDEATFSYRDTARAYLQGLAELLNSQTSGIITVTGLTDDYGTIEHQVDVATRRAQAVIDVLVEFGVPADRLVGQGLGSQFACFDPNNDDANRRVVITTSLQRPEDICQG